MTFQFHCIVQNAADIDNPFAFQSVEQQMARLAHDATEQARLRPAVAQMIAAHRRTEFGPANRARTPGIFCNIPESCYQKGLIASSRKVAEVLVRPGQDREDIGFGRCGEAECCHVQPRWLACLPKAAIVPSSSSSEMNCARP